MLNNPDTYTRYRNSALGLINRDFSNSSTARDIVRVFASLIKE